MGCWDVVCSLCALTLNSCSEECKKWMHDTKEIACNTDFYDKKKLYISPLFS